MAYLALYRAFRPTTLDKVVRQEHIVKILRNQIEQDRIGHAYLFCGPRGTGKTSIAKIFARAINCTSPVNGSPCGKCANCKALQNGGSLDVVEIDAASNNGVDEMRDLREKVQYPPVNGRYKVYIIDEVHMLSSGAFNALLKTLEEPPKHAVFILATTEAQKIPATILSRCMRFDFKLIPQEDLENHLKGILNTIGKEYEEEAVAAIARAGNGSVRDMLSIADICVSYDEGKLTYQDVCAVLGSADFDRMATLCDNMLLSNVASLSTVEDILSEGKGVGILVKDILQFLNDCAIAKMCKNYKEILAMPSENCQKVKEIADRADGHRILRVTEIFADAESKLRYSASARILLETAVVKATMPQTDYDIESLLTRVTAIEKTLSNGSPLPVVTPTPVEKKMELQTAFPEQEELPPPLEEVFFDEDEREQPVKEEKTEQQTPVGQKEEVIQKTPPTVTTAVPKESAPVGAVDKGKAFGLFLRSLRKGSRNGVLFTMCSELDCTFENEKMVLVSESETIFRSLQRPEHRAAIEQALSAIGITDFDIRLKGQNGDQTAAEAEKIKRDFSSTPVTVK